ncbi:hypothetical protein R5R35_000489 [Gryllus longicercus]|uniref:Mitochondrial glycine transporter n=2 Tax=Gryllus longicercus TaxID=2509291 RepID=A0AAN9VC55_9ORTH
MCRSKAPEPYDVNSTDKKCVPSGGEDIASVWKLWSASRGDEELDPQLSLEGLTPKKELDTDQTSTENRSAIMEIVSNNPILKSFLAGSLSGTCSTVMFQPLDLVKTRLQNPSPVAIGTAASGASTYSTGSMISIVGRIVQKEHIFGLWKGMTPSLTRCIPGVGLYFMSVDVMKSHLISNEPSPLQAVAIGMSARTLSGVCLIPVTVIKTRYESGVYNYTGVINAFRIIYRTEGLRGLSCGLLPTLVRDAPFSGLYLMFYTQTKKLTTDWQKSSLSAPANFCCGIVAGIMASIVTQPADVLKTKMQLFPQKFDGMHSVVLYVYQKYGIKGYFKGLVPRMLRRTLMAAMAWTVYEQLTRSIGLK